MKPFVEILEDRTVPSVVPHPVALGTYLPIKNGQLFVNGVSYTDIHQGQSPDCGFLAALADVANANPQAIVNMFTDNHDGTFTVALWDSGHLNNVLVDQYIPVASPLYLGQAEYAYGQTSVRVTGPYVRSPVEMWVSLVEKAWAELEGNNYANIGYTTVAQGLYALTGRGASFGNPIDANAIIAAVNSGKLVGLVTVLNPSMPTLVGNHAYAVLSVDPVHQTITLFNPWGNNTSVSKPGTLTISLTDLLANFSYWDSLT